MQQKPFHRHGDTCSNPEIVFYTLNWTEGPSTSTTRMLSKPGQIQQEESCFAEEQITVESKDALLEFWPKLRLCFFKNVSCIFKDFLNFCVFEEQLFWLFHCFLLFSLPSHWHSSWVGLYSTQTHMTRWTSWRTVRTLLRTWCSTTWNATRMKSRKFW